MLAIPIIQTRHIGKTVHSHAGARRVLQDVCLELRPGERIALVGANGSGKTTLIRLILGIDKPDEGTLTVQFPQNRRPVFYVPQDYRNALFPWLRLRTNLAMANPNVAGVGKGGQVHKHAGVTFETIVELFRLHLDFQKFPYQLSGGEQQLFLLAMAIAANPALLVLDEALSAVDYGRRRIIQHYLGAWLELGNTTMIMATHDFEEAVLLADRAIVLDARSGLISAVVPIPLPWPRTQSLRSTREFQLLVEAVTQAVP